MYFFIVQGEEATFVTVFIKPYLVALRVKKKNQKTLGAVNTIPNHSKNNIQT